MSGFLLKIFIKKQSFFSFFFCTFDFPHTFDRVGKVRLIRYSRGRTRSDPIRVEKGTSGGTFRRCGICYAMRNSVMPDAIVSVRFSGGINSILHLAIRATRPRKPLCSGQFSTDDTQPRRVGRVLLRRKSAKYRSHL